jgi:hypothetical protein
MTCGFCKSIGLFTFETHDIKRCRRLANTRCGYCKGFGHTPNYCKKLAKKTIKQAAETICQGVQFRLICESLCDVPIMTRIDLPPLPPLPSTAVYLRTAPPPATATNVLGERSRAPMAAELEKIQTSLRKRIPHSVQSRKEYCLNPICLK